MPLPVRQPFDAPSVFHFLGVRALPGVELAELPADGPLRYARTLLLPHGPGVIDVLASRDHPKGWSVRVDLQLATLADEAVAIAHVRRLLDLDAGGATVDAALATDPVLAPRVAATPGIRVPGAVDPHEMVVRALVGQQISVAAARTHLARLATLAGTAFHSGVPGLDRLFPTAGQVATVMPAPADGEPLDPARPLRLPGRAIRTVLGTADALDRGELRVDAAADPETMRAQLLARPGIGPWTASYIAMRVLGDPDAWLVGDVALVAGAKSLGMLDTGMPARTAHQALAKRAEAWAPWRSYAAMHLWQAAAPATPPAAGPSRS